jgi:RHS repeat-associated protein
MYNPELGRFVNRDPIGYDAGDSNLYRYCRDKPLSALDPTGQTELCGFMDAM